MQALGSFLFNLFLIPWQIIENGRGILFEGGDYAGMVFLVLTLVLGGSMAFASGRAIALTWRPFIQVPVYMLPLTAMIRFLHYALFDETLLSLFYFAVTFLILGLFALWGYQVTRAGQMVRQYPWAFARAGRFGWRNSA